MGYRASDARDLLNALGSSNITLPRIERRLISELKCPESRAQEARSIEAILAGYMEESVRYADQYEEKACAAATLDLGELHRRQSEGFRNSAQRARALLERLAHNLDWP